MRSRSIGTVSIGMLAVLAACQQNADDIRQLREGQRMIMAKLSDLEKKIEQGAARPAAAPQPPDPNRVYNIPAGNSPFKGPADAPVVLTEFSDFQ
jgi:protein-disulfide isomerase